MRVLIPLDSVCPVLLLLLIFSSFSSSTLSHFLLQTHNFWKEYELPNRISPYVVMLTLARRAGSDGSISASGSVGLEFDPRRGSKFSTSGLGWVEMYTF